MSDPDMSTVKDGLTTIKSFVNSVDGLVDRLDNVQPDNVVTPNAEDRYTKLCDTVGRIDEQAAEYMRNKAKALESFKRAGSLVDCFNWHSTPQGGKYWDEIHKEVVSKFGASFSYAIISYEEYVLTRRVRDQSYKAAAITFIESMLTNIEKVYVYSNPNHRSVLPQDFNNIGHDFKINDFAITPEAPGELPPVKPIKAVPGADFHFCGLDSSPGLVDDEELYSTVYRSTSMHGPELYSYWDTNKETAIAYSNRWLRINFSLEYDNVYKYVRRVGEPTSMDIKRGA